MSDLDRVRALLREAGFGNENGNGDVCINCSAAFSHDNVYSDAGWMETQISGLCELCFDKVCEEKEDEV